MRSEIYIGFSPVLSVGHSGDQNKTAALKMYVGKQWVQCLFRDNIRP